MNRHLPEGEAWFYGIIMFPMSFYSLVQIDRFVRWLAWFTWEDLFVFTVELWLAFWIVPAIYKVLEAIVIISFELIKSTPRTLVELVADPVGHLVSFWDGFLELAIGLTVFFVQAIGFLISIYVLSHLVTYFILYPIILLAGG